MKIELTEQQFRYLLDLVYIGNWVMNSTREDDRIKEYDQVESLVFSHCLQHKMSKLVELYHGELIPSRAFADGGAFPAPDPAGGEPHLFRGHRPGALRGPLQGDSAEIRQTGCALSQVL